MKRKVLILILFSELVFSCLTAILLVNLALANPAPELDFPREPVVTLPTIVIHSPVQNQNYNSTDVLLNFTIIKPDAWIQPPGRYGGGDAEGNPVYEILGNITSVYYVVDGGERQNISVFDISTQFDYHPKRSLNVSTSFMLSKGAHSISVGFEADSYFMVYDVYTAENATTPYEPGLQLPVGLSSVMVYADSDHVDFTVLQEPFPFAFAATAEASITVAIACLLLYLKKRGR